MSNSFEYRHGVVGVFTNDQGLVLVGERSDVKGAWQLPQGGVDPGESTLGALYREMDEELGASDFKILSIASRQVRYQFPESMKSGPAQRYAGQVQQWYRLQFAPGAKPDISKADGEFTDFDWRTPAQVVADVIDWKRDAYREGFRLLGLEC